MSIKFKNLNKTIIKCKKCPRLVNFIKKVSKEKRKQNIDEIYWGKPVTGFGDIQAKILISLIQLQYRIKVDDYVLKKSNETSSKTSLCKT